jgi:hypothetical protein
MFRRGSAFYETHLSRRFDLKTGATNLVVDILLKPSEEGRYIRH